MTQDPVFYFGLAFLGAAIVGGGLKLAGTEIPVLKSWVRQLGAAVLGAVLIYFAYGNHRFRVTGVTLHAVGAYRGFCPGWRTFEGTISTQGGDGTVEYRLFTAGYTSQRRERAVQGNGTRGFEELVTVYRSGSEVAQLKILAPNEKMSPAAPFSVVCTNVTPTPAPTPRQSPAQTPTG